MCSLTTAPTIFKENKMKTIVTIIGLVLLLTTTAQATHINQDVCGDVNDDFTVTSLDALLVLHKVVGLHDLDHDYCQGYIYDFPCGDVNCDNLVTVTDAARILRESVGLDTGLICDADCVGRTSN
jgi:hypothetical protein